MFCCCCCLLLLFVCLFGSFFKYYILADISFTITWLLLGQSCDHPSPSEAITDNMIGWYITIIGNRWCYHKKTAMQLCAYHWKLCCRWWHRKLPLRQFTVPPVTTKLSNWQPFFQWSWWCHQMEAFSALLAGPGEFPTQRPVTRSFDVFFDLRLNKRLSK